MKLKEVTINLRRFNITEFSSVSDALENLPPEIVLRYINMGWRNTQMMTIANAMKERY